MNTDHPEITCHLPFKQRNKYKYFQKQSRKKHNGYIKEYLKGHISMAPKAIPLSNTV